MKIEQHQFALNGWIIVDFQDPSPILEARSMLQEELSSILGKDSSLEDYHKLVPTEKHTEVQIHMTDFFRKKKFGRQIIEKTTSPFFKPF